MSPDDRDERAPTERRASPRVPAHHDVEVKIGDWYTTRVMPHDVSEGGVRLTIPGGATEGQQYAIGLRYGEVEIRLLGQAQWVRVIDDEHTEVGLSFMDTSDTTPDTFRYFFERLSSDE